MGGMHANGIGDGGYTVRFLPLFHQQLRGPG
jgi:hypothetical protein